ncbi:MAG: hypothetical protein ACQETQ_11365 [Spirochaetota bacterium]
MPWKLIGFLVVVGLILAFVGFNAANVSDISFGFYELEEVPIFISLFAAFALGVLITLPFTLLGRSKGAKKRPKQEKKGAGSEHDTEPAIQPEQW